METIKSFTSLEQSKKLAEILPIESADMTWIEEEWGEPIVGKIIKSPDEDYTFIPCWSLAALIDALPLGLEIHDISDGHKKYYYVEMYTKEIYMKLKRMNNPEICLSTERHENLVDACVGMIYKLKENNLL